MDNPFFKTSYFQGGGGVNEPTPHKKKYKSEKAIVIQPRFKEPFYRNYDAYDVPGADGKINQSGPGTGWHSMHKYKSISEFLKEKRRNMQDKYKADDSWIEDTESNKKDRVQKMKTRAKLLYKLTKYAIDFPIDDQVTPILGDSGTYSDSVPIGGITDEYLPLNDFEGKSSDVLDFGRDYTEEDIGEQEIVEETITPAESSLYGMPDGIIPIEDLDSPSSEDPRYGTTDLGNNTYDKMWI